MSFDHDKHSIYFRNFKFFFSKLSYTLQIPDTKRYPNARKASIPNAHLLIKSGKWGVWAKRKP